MNERIKELAEQATTITYEDDGWRLYGTEVETFNKQKFAELIVRECAAYVEGTGNWLVAMEMKEHFGVEE